MAVNDIFSADPVEPVNTEITLADLVGEDKKYRDPDEVAKAYANAEGHIRQLERDNAMLRAKADLANNNRNDDPNPDAVQPPNPDPERPEPRNPNGGEDLRSRIREEVIALTQEERAVGNAEAAAQKMVEVYGTIDKANEAVRRRAAELGVSTEWLHDTASRSPSAFYASMGINPNAAPENRETPASSPEVQMARGDPKKRNFEYYENLRKTDQKAYWTAAVQREMMSQAKAMGEDFYR